MRPDPMQRACALGLTLTVLAISLVGCGGGTSALKVSAAASLRAALLRFGAGYGHVTFSFAGSDQLAAQIRAGARPDVFASANTKLPEALFASKLVERPIPFATNRLVLAVPARGGRVKALADVARPGTRLVVGSPSVPVGAYTDTVLARLGALGSAIRARIVSREPSVDGIAAKLTTGAADAGFLYTTDVRATHGAVRALELPVSARPKVVYAAAVVLGAPQPARARSFIAGLRSGAGRSALADAGFGPPPG